jgi:Flp pilus assembly protein TadD
MVMHRWILWVASGLWALLVSTTAAAQSPPDALRLEDTAESAKAIPLTPSRAGAYANALRLARALDDDGLVAELLSHSALDRASSQADVAAVVEAYEALGDPARAVDFLKQRLSLFPLERETRVELAHLYARAGDAKSSVREWREIESRAPGSLTTAESDDYARELSMTGDAESAYRVLEAGARTAPEEAEIFWVDLATLSWELDFASEALVAYRVVCAHHFNAPGAVQRLMQLAAGAGAIDEAIAVGLKEFQATGDASTLLEAARLQSEKSDWAAVKRTLDQAPSIPDDLAHDPEFWLLRGEAHARLGDAKTARQSYVTALALAPSSATAQAALLWDALDQNDNARLRIYIDRWTKAADGAAELWAPFAVGLDRLGRTRESIPFFVRHLRAEPSDFLFVLEFAGALERAGNGPMAVRLRTFAVGKLQNNALAALRAPSLTLDQRQLLEETATIKRLVNGAQIGERWLSALLRTPGARESEVAFAADWDLAEDRIDSAQHRLESPKRLEGPSWDEARLSIALADNDFATAETLLGASNGIDAADRIEALLDLERDRLAGAAIVEASDPLAHSDELQDKLVQIRDRHAPVARLGGTFVYIGGLDVFGPLVAGADDWGSARMIYTASAVQMRAPAGVLLLRSPVDEAEATVTARTSSYRGVTELAGAFDVQPTQSYQGMTPLPKVTFFDQRLLTDVFGTTLEAVVDDKIEDTSLLRVGAVESRIEVGMRADFERSFYGSTSIHVRDDYTRAFRQVGAEAGEEAEVGYKIATHEPEWDIGLQGLAVQRRNVNQLPAAIAGLIPAGADLALYIPPTYELASIVTHLTRGDFWQRYRPDRTAFPSYDCEAAIGILFPDLDGAFHVQCSVSVLVHGGSVSAVTFFNRGVAGISNQTNAEATLSYTQPF